MDGTEQLDAFLAAFREDWVKAGSPSPMVVIAMVNEFERLRSIEQCARYLVNSDAWVGDTDGIEANLTTLRELLRIPAA